MATAAATLKYWDKNPPFAALVASKLSEVAIEAVADPTATKDTPVSLKLTSGDEFTGLPMILRYLARAGKQQAQLYGTDALTATQVDYWLDISVNVVGGSALEGLCAALNKYLSLRTFFVGYHVSLADLAVWGQLQGTPFWRKIRGSGSVPHLVRWFDHLSSQDVFQEALAAGESKKKAGESKKAGGAEASRGTSAKGAAESKTSEGLPELPGAVMGKVVTRFPPEPSGYLHVGHAKAALINQAYADMYNGILRVRFDDTNPSKEKDEYVDNIIKDINDLGLKYDKITYTSDYFPQLFECGEKLIKLGVLYTDDTPVDQMRQERMDGVESRCRNRSVEENLKLWEEMKKGSEVGLKNCVRIKMDMQAANKALRDPTMFRCNLTHHWRTAQQYKVYPTYDFACPFVDAYEGITHAMRTSEYKDREEQFYRILTEQQKVWPGLPRVLVLDYARLNFVYTVLSKRKLTWFVDTHKVEGWNDPRMPTVQGILRRGMKIEALKEFIISQGFSKNVTYQEWDKIWTMNKKVIDPVCPRHTAVDVKDKVPVEIINGPAETEVLTVPRHKKYAGAGEKSLHRGKAIWLAQVDAKQLQLDEEVTLMDWGNAFIREINTDAEGVVTSMKAELHLAGDVKKTKWKLTWLTQDSGLVDLTLVDFDNLITKKKVEEDDDFMQLVNPTTRFETPAIGDCNMSKLVKGEIIQLERKGYFIVDQPSSEGKPVVVLNIPDGRTKNMTKQ